MARDGRGARLWQWLVWISLTGLCAWIASSAIINLELAMLGFATLSAIVAAAVLRPGLIVANVSLASATAAGATFSLDLPQYGAFFAAVSAAWAASRVSTKQSNAGVWTALCLAGFLVGFFSGARGAAGDFAERVAEWLNIGLPAAERLVFEVRKGIHVAAYGTIGWLAFRAGSTPDRSTLDFQVGFAVAIPLALAILDEGRQMMLPTRTGTTWDIALNMVGAVLFVGIALYARLTGEPASKPEG